MSDIQKSTTAKNLKLAFAPLVTNIMTEAGQTANIAFEVKNNSTKAIDFYTNDKGNAGKDSFTFSIEFPQGILKKTVNQSQDMSSTNFSTEQTLGDWKVRTSENVIYFLATKAQSIESQVELKLKLGKLMVNRDSTSTQVTFTYRHKVSVQQTQAKLQKRINQFNQQIQQVTKNIANFKTQSKSLETQANDFATRIRKLNQQVRALNSPFDVPKKAAKQMKVSQFQQQMVQLRNQKAAIDKNIPKLQNRKVQFQKQKKRLEGEFGKNAGKTSIIQEEFTQSHFVTLDQTKAPLDMSASVHGTLINSGEDNTVYVYLVNTSRNEIEFSTKSTMQIVFKKGKNEPHALTDQDETTTNITAAGFSVEQNQTAIDPTYDLRCTKKLELKPEQSIKIAIKNLKTTLSPRIGYLYIDYEKVSDYRDGRMIIPVSIGSAQYRLTDSALMIKSKYVDVHSPNQLMFYNQGIRARADFLLNSDTGKNITIQSGKALTIKSKEALLIDAGTKNLTLAGSKVILDGTIELKGKANSAATGVSSSDYARIYGEHVKNTEISSMVFEIGDNTNDAFVFRNKIHNKPTKEMLKINYDSILVNGAKPFLLKTFNIQVEVNYNTGYKTSIWRAIVGGWDGKAWDINEGGNHDFSAQMFQDKGTWWIDMDFGTHSKTKKAGTVKVLFIKNEICGW